METADSDPARHDAGLAFLRDKDAIRDLPVRYCQLVVAGDVDGLFGLFTADGTFGLPSTMGDGVLTGGALRTMIADSMVEKKPWPLVHNHVITFQDADRATGKVHAEIRMGDQGLKLTHLYIYDDEYVRDAGVWKFKHRGVSSFPVTG